MKAMITWDEPGCLCNIGQVVQVTGNAGTDPTGRPCVYIVPDVTASDYVYLEDSDETLRAWCEGDGALYHPAAWLVPLAEDGMQATNQEQEVFMTDSYHFDPDSGNLFAVAKGGIWRLFADQRATGPWSFFPPGTEGYDYFHQKIFRQHATEVVPVDELDPPPPPLPPAPKGPFPTWAENQGKGRPAGSGRYPSLTSRLKGAGEDGLPVYVVLIEDHYESMFGDGKSLDLHAASLDRERAETITGRPHSQYETLSLRKFTLRLSGDRLVSRDYDPQRYEHYPLESVLALLERELRADGEVAAGQAG